MCKIIEDMVREERQEAKQEGILEMVRSLLADGTLALEKIAELAGLPLDEVKKLKAEQGA